MCIFNMFSQKTPGWYNEREKHDDYFVLGMLGIHTETTQIWPTTLHLYFYIKPQNGSNPKIWNLNNETTERKCRRDTSIQNLGDLYWMIPQSQSNKFTNTAMRLHQTMTVHHNVRNSRWDNCKNMRKYFKLFRWPKISIIFYTQINSATRTSPTHKYS